MSMLTSFNSVKHLRCYGERQQKAWRLRLIPHNSKDSWRGPMPSIKGVKRATWLNMTNCVYFIFRNKKLKHGVESTRYTLRLNWRQRWYVDMPLGNGMVGILPVDARRLIGFIGTEIPNHPSATCLMHTAYFKFLEKFMLRGVIPLLNSYLRSLWASVFRGVGGVSRLKVRYKGKSFKWHRRKNSLMLRFGHSHLVALSPYPGVRWKRFGRMKIIFFGSNWWDLIEFAQAVCWWRPVNVYHGRGIRLRRQAILRKAGKVSAYR